MANKLEERAEQLLRGYSENVIIAAEVAAFARQIAKEQAEDDARAICQQCAAGIPLKQFGDVLAHVNTMPCAAAAIRQNAERNWK